MVEDRDNKENIQTVGELLKDTRLKMGKTVGDAADELCIRKFYIKAIEDMDFKNIPPIPYGLGFIRSYAKYLGLDGETIVASYRQSILGGDIEQDYDAHTSESSGPKLRHILFGLIGLGLAFVAWSVLPSTEQVEEYSDKISEVMPEPVIIDEIVNGEEKSGNEINVTEDVVSDEDTENTEINADEDKIVRENEDTKDEAVNNAIKMVLDGPSWIELRKGEKVLLVGTYKAGYEYEIPAEKGYTITVGRPQNVKFLKNGEKLVVATRMKKSKISLDKFVGKQK